MIDALSRLAILYGTDKFGYHDYTPNYFRLLGSWRDRPLRMLEIGVGGYGDEDRGGESLEVWRDFFPQGQITGIDIQRKTMNLGPRVSILQGSQIDADFLDGVNRDRGPFDIILDDGSHRNEHVVETFGLLFSRLQPGGIYLVEDVQTAFIPRFGGSLTLDQPNSVGLFAALMDKLRDGRAGDIVAVERFHNIVALHKHAPDAPRPGIGDHPALRSRLNGIGAGTLGAGGDVAGVRLVAGAAPALPEDLDAAIETAGEGGLVVIQGWPADGTLLHDLFVQIDHREIAVNFPDAPIHGIARRVLSLAAYRDGLVLEVGANDYPSNFAFDHEHPRVAAAIEAMGKVLESPEARPNGLLQYTEMIGRYRGHQAAYPILDRLAAAGSTERRYYQLAGVRAIQARAWPELITLYEAALQHYRHDGHFASTLARAYKAVGQPDRAERLLRTSYDANPKARPIVVALAQLEQEAGRYDDAIGLFEDSINLFPRPARAQRLELLVHLCRRADRPDRALRACKRWLDLEPDSKQAAGILQELGG